MSEDFIDLVLEMRKAQVAYGFGRKPSTYQRRIKAEHRVDEYISKARDEPYVETVKLMEPMK